MPRRCVRTSPRGPRGGEMMSSLVLSMEGKMSSVTPEGPVFDVRGISYDEGSSVMREDSAKMWEATDESLIPDDEGISFPLSQPEPPCRKQQQLPSVQRRRRSAACCSAPYIAAGHHQRLLGPLCAARGSRARREHTPPALPRSPLESPVEDASGERAFISQEAERVACALAETAVTSAHALAADAKGIDPAYAAKPTAFLYKGHTAQIATSTAGMYGEMIESFTKQVVAYAREYGADEFGVFCDLGSGRGAPCAIAAYEHQWLACLGIEKCPQAFGLSLETQRVLLLRDAFEQLSSIRAFQGPLSPHEDRELFEEELKALFECRPQRAVAFAHDDLSAFVDLEGVTHGYSFDAAMEGPLVNHITQMFMDTETWWFYLSFRNDLISRFDLKGAEIKAQISSNMWVSSEGRTAYVYVKTDWKERQRKHRQWLRDTLLAPELQQQAKQQQLLRHVRIQQQLVLEQLQREDEQSVAAAAATETPGKTPRSSRRGSLSPVGTPRNRSSSRMRCSGATESQRQQQQMVLFHLAARRQQLQVLNQLEPKEQQQQQEESDAASDKELLEQLRTFCSTHLRLSKWHQPLTIRSLLLVSLLPFEGQHQWLLLQQQLLQPAAGVLTRTQRAVLLGYDESERKEEERQRDKWLEQLAATTGPEETKRLRIEIKMNLIEQRRQDMSLFSFLPPQAERNSVSATSTSSLPDGAALRLGFRHSLQELQERQSPLRTPASRRSCGTLASRESSPVLRAVLPSAAAAAAAAAVQHQQRRSPVRQGAKKRISNQSLSPVSSRRRPSAAVAAAALAAAEAAAAASPLQPRGKSTAALGTPNGRRALQKVERELQGLDVRGVDTSSDPFKAPMSQDAS